MSRCTEIPVRSAMAVVLIGASFSFMARSMRMRVAYLERAEIFIREPVMNG